MGSYPSRHPSLWRGDRQCASSTNEKSISAVVVGAGQSGVSTSYYLSKSGVDHVVLEADPEPGNSWKKLRWDSFRLVTENSLCNLPDFNFQQYMALKGWEASSAQDFMTRDEITQYVQDFAKEKNVTVQGGVEVTSIKQAAEGKWRLETSNGVSYTTDNVIMCIGPFQGPRLPPITTKLPENVLQLHSSEYKRPSDLPPGNVLVVGSAQSGTQIAKELAEAGGRKTFLAVGKTALRVPRKVFGKDFTWWLWKTGMYDTSVDDLGEDIWKKRFGPNPSQAARVDVRLRQLANDHGLQLVGRLEDCNDGVLEIADTLRDSMVAIEENVPRMVGIIEAYVNKHASTDPQLQGLPDQPPEPNIPIPLCEKNPRRTLDLQAENITTVIWATGWSFDFNKLVDLPDLYVNGYPNVRRGVSAYDGLYFQGLNWGWKWKSALFLGCAEDAKNVVEHLVARGATQRATIAGQDKFSVAQQLLNSAMSKVATQSSTPLMLQSFSAEDRLALFKSYDVSKSGDLTREEAMRFFTDMVNKMAGEGTLEPVAVQDAAEHLFVLCDKNKDGVIQFEEFELPPPYLRGLQITAEEADKNPARTFVDLIPDSERACILGTDSSKKPLTFHRLRDFIHHEVDLTRFGITHGDRVCTALKNGPISAVSFLALSTRCTLAPLNPKLTEEEFVFEYEDMPAKALIVEQLDASAEIAIKVAQRMNVPVIELCPSFLETGTFTLEGKEVPQEQRPANTMADSEDIALVLHTSGTTKKPKIVPLTHRNMVVGAQCIASTLQLEPDDICLNVMPLFHIHGLAVNVLVSAISGTSVICSGDFDTEVFFRILAQEQAPTWYSAVPSMHQEILKFAEAHIASTGEAPKHSLHLIRNCSAALLPNVSSRMQQVFGCTVLPTYAMTESMPICSPNPHAVGSLAAVGPAAGPALKIMAAHPEERELAPFEEGEVCVKGPCVTAGYEFRDHMSENPNIEGFTPSGWLRTGDKGYVDENGQLFLVGRFKEIISRGGEKISPFEVEDALLNHPAIDNMIAFAVPHKDLGEVVGAAVVLKPGRNATLKDVRMHGLKTMSRKWLPEVIVYMDKIPKGPTGKPARIKLAERLGIEEMTLEQNCSVAFDVGLVPRIVTGKDKIAGLRAMSMQEDIEEGEDGVTSLTHARLDMNSLQDSLQSHFLGALQNSIAQLLGGGLEPHDVIKSRRLSALGLDSMCLSALRTQLETMGAPLPLGTLASSSVADLSKVLAGQFRVVASDAAGTLAEGPAKATPLEMRPEEAFDQFPLGNLPLAYYLGRSEEVVGSSAKRAHISWEVELADFDKDRFEKAVNKLIQRHGMMRAELKSGARQRIVKDFEFTLKHQTPPEDAAPGWFDDVLSQIHADNYVSRSFPLWGIEAVESGGGRTRLVFSVDLVIADAQSLQVLTRELTQLYENPDAALTPLELSFRDYAAGVKNLEQTETYARDRDYWMARARDEDAGLPPCPDLPTSSVMNYQMSRLKASLLPQLWQSLQATAAAHDLTPTTVLVTAYARALSGWARKDKFILNLTQFNRPLLHPQSSQILGNTAGVMLLEVNVSSQRSFLEDATAIQKQLWQDQEHASFNGLEVMQEMNRLTGTQGRPVAPYVFASALGATAKEAEAKNLFPWFGSRPLNTHLETPQIYLDHQVFNEPDGSLALHWDFARQVFPDGMMSDIFQSYIRCLEALGEPACWDDVSAKVSEALTPAQKRVLATVAGEAKQPIQTELLMTPMKTCIAESSYGSWAVVDGRSGLRLTHPGLLDAASKVAARIAETVGSSEAPVPVLMDKGWEQAVACCGVLLSGRAYVPVNVMQPPSRVLFILESLEAKTCLSTPRMWSEQQDSVYLDHDWHSIQWPAEVPLLMIDDSFVPDSTAQASASTDLASVSGVKKDVGLDDLAYVIFTSGSTGTPKGVMISHRGASNTCIDINKRWNVTSSDSVLSLASLSFDLSVWDLFGLMTHGGKLVMPDESKQKDPTHWLDLLEQEQVTVWNTAPPVMHIFLEYVLHVAEAEQRFRDVPLRLVMLSGDWIPLEVPRRLKRLLPNVEVVSLGGATEASIWSNYFNINEVDPSWDSIPYGKPLSNQTMDIRGSNLELLPTYAHGEICIGGDGLAMGYWKDPEKTAKAFVELNGQRLYKTGDMGSWYPDGNIKILGRIDFQVKISGYRIELGEIESVLQDSGLIDESMVVAIGKGAGARLVGFLKPVKEGALPEEELSAQARDKLLAKLPTYMVPSRFIVLSDWPLSPNGKVDRKALLAMAEHDAQASDQSNATSKEVVPPRTDTESKLHAIWSSIVGESAGTFGIFESFTQVGGTSLGTIQLINRVEQDFGSRLSFTQVQEDPTIASLARFLDGGQEVKQVVKASPIVALNPSGKQRPFFFAPPVGGQVYCYQKWKEALGVDQPFYAFRSPGLEPGEKPLETVEEMAESYVDALLERFDEGPYLLGGWSMGGCVAFEMARVLEARGKEVENLVMLDSPSPLYSTVIGDAPNDVELLHGLAVDIANGRRIDIPTVGELSKLPYDECLAKVFDCLVEQRILPKEFGGDMFKAQVKVYSANMKALRLYRPDLRKRPLGTTFHLLRASEVSPGLQNHQFWEDPYFGWTHLGVSRGSILLHEYGGDHFTIVSEDVDESQSIAYQSARYLRQPRRFKQEVRTVGQISQQVLSPELPGDHLYEENSFRTGTASSIDSNTHFAVQEAFAQLLRRLQDTPHLIAVHCTDHYSPEVVLQVLRQLAPKATIYGGSSCGGVMTDDGYVSHNGRGLALFGIVDADGRYCAGQATGAGDPTTARVAGASAARSAMTKAKTLKKPAACIVTGVPGAEEEILKGIQDVIGQGTDIIGGSSADNDVAGNWYQMGPMGSTSDGVVVTMLWPSVHTSVTFKSAYRETPGALGRVTKASGRTVHEIDGRPAADMYNEWSRDVSLGKLLESSPKLPPEGVTILGDTTLEPLAKRLRVPAADDMEESIFHQLMHPAKLYADGSMDMFAEVNEGDELTCMIAEKHHLAQRLDRMTTVAAARAPFEDSEILGGMVIYCGGCSLAIKDDMPAVAKQIRRVLNHKAFVGAFAFGEQGVSPLGVCHGNLMYGLLLFGGRPKSGINALPTVSLYKNKDSVDVP